MYRADNIFLGILLLCVSLSAACQASSRVPAPDNHAPAKNGRTFVVHVFDAQPSPGSSGEDLLIPAALSVEDTAVVLAQREGRIMNLRGQEGARVIKGNVLAQFNEDDQRSQVRQAELEVSRLQVEEEQYEALVKLNRSELERELSLARDGVSSKADVERAQYKLDQAVKEYEKTRLATESARARVEAVKLELDKSTVRAPISGIITRRYVALGTNVARNDKLFEVSKLSPLEVKFQLPQTENDKLAPGRVVQLSAVNSDHAIARARIRRIEPVADATSHTFGYVADIVRGSGLMPGLAVNVHLPRAAGAPVFWIPRAAFPSKADLHNGAISTLFVIDGEKCSAHNVVVNVAEGDQVEIVSGIVANDRVILMPPSELKDGDLVAISPG
ncbi:MAG TPA: efflux RND transporter periplasmic adaptor subunit [Pyrinomonadaceae bacterium]|nr:efflux RND transporter periplasmic adaptor subunit [Pyrinomonadaceae bacterium]